MKRRHRRPARRLDTGTIAIAAVLGVFAFSFTFGAVAAVIHILGGL